MNFKISPTPGSVMFYLQSNIFSFPSPVFLQHKRNPPYGGFLLNQLSLRGEPIPQFFQQALQQYLA
ncbi:hypothetical protein D9M71_19970 [compost metagenome]